MYIISLTLHHKQNGKIEGLLVFFAAFFRAATGIDRVISEAV